MIIENPTHPIKVKPDGPWGANPNGEYWLRDYKNVVRLKVDNIFYNEDVKTFYVSMSHDL